MDVALLVDGSGSIRPHNFVRLKAFLSRLIRRLKVGYYDTRIALVQFSKSARVEFYLNKYRRANDVINAIKQMRQMRGGTYLHRGLSLIRTRVFKRWSGDRANVKNTLIIFTDGVTKLYRTARGETDRLRQQNVHILVVGIGKKQTVNRLSTQLSTYSSAPVGRNMFLHGFSGLRSIAGRLARMACMSKYPIVCHCLSV